VLVGSNVRACPDKPLSSQRCWAMANLLPLSFHFSYTILPHNTSS
jgi:hypothetical protein